MIPVERRVAISRRASDFGVALARDILRTAYDIQCGPAIHPFILLPRLWISRLIAEQVEGFAEGKTRLYTTVDTRIAQVGMPEALRRSRSWSTLQTDARDTISGFYRKATENGTQLPHHRRGRRF